MTRRMQRPRARHLALQRPRARLLARSADALRSSTPLSRHLALQWTSALCLPAVAVAALWPSTWAYVLFAAVGHVTDRRTATPRFLLRDVALLLLLIRQGHVGGAGFAALAVGLFGLHGVRAAYTALAILIRRRRRLPFATRGIDLGALGIPDAPRQFAVVYLDVPVIAGALLGLAPWGLVVGYALGLAALAHLARHLLRNLPLGDRQRAFDVLNARLAELAPEVVLYFSGSTDSAYQVNMWLSTLDGLGHRALILLRERPLLPLLGRTATPAVCVPGTPDLVKVDLSTVRCALYPANVGKNLHLLRVPGIRSAFINHGDSDKPASFNPFARAYDEVWVAGPAGRRRYLETGSGVRDEDIVEVGRPQLAPIDTTGVTPDPVFTVLYAPTWEGWSEDLAHSSVATMGPRIVRALLDRPGLRLLYKPHPLTGTRDPRATQRHEEIVAMIERATGAARPVRTSRERPFTPPGDEAQISRDSVGDSRAEDATDGAFWAAGDHHRVITGPSPRLYDCFNHTDLLITDISSVAGDFIVSGKPYAVTNVAGLDPEAFRREFPTAAHAAYLIGPDCGELPEILAEARGEGSDAMAARRAELRRDLLGDDGPDPAKRFAEAVNALISGARP
jgi:hypothetical protein